MILPKNLICMSVLILCTVFACADGTTGTEAQNGKVQPQATSPYSNTASTLSNGPSGSEMIATESLLTYGQEGDVTSGSYDYLVSATLSQPNSQTVEVNLSSNSQGTTPQGFTIDGNDASARNMVTSASYSGGSNLNYTINGQQKTASLDGYQQNLMSEVHQEFNTAELEYNNMPAPTGGSNPLLTKTDQQIKQMLESEGYTVTSLGNMKFEITKTIETAEVTQVFDAETFSMSNTTVNYSGDPDYSAYFQGGTYQPIQSLQQ